MKAEHSNLDPGTPPRRLPFTTPPINETNKKARDICHHLRLRQPACPWQVLSSITITDTKIKFSTTRFVNVRNVITVTFHSQCSRPLVKVLLFMCNGRILRSAKDVRYIPSVPTPRSRGYLEKDAFVGKPCELCVGGRALRNLV